MTIQQILKHHGYNCSRQVLPSGRLVFDTSTTAVSIGLPLTSHTFHGGAESEDAGSGSPWWLNAGALEDDRDAMEAHFPAFVEIEHDAEHPPGWCGPVETRMGKFVIAVMHRFDRSLPSVIPLEPDKRGKQVGRRFLEAPHTYTSGKLCVAAQEDWDPGRDSIATVVAWAAHWHAFYVEWYFTGKWPSEQYVVEVA